MHYVERDSLLPEWERFLEESHKMSPVRREKVLKYHFYFFLSSSVEIFRLSTRK